MVLALAVFLVARRLMPRPAAFARLCWEQRTGLSLAAFVGGVLGGKVPWILTDSQNWLRLTAWLADGKTITTGLIGAYVAVECAKPVLGVRVKTGDTFALPLALALAVGRWGCFFNGCCHGVATSLPWAVAFRTDGGAWIRCHPTQVYESLFHLTMAVVLGCCLRRGAFRNQQLQLYLIAYCVFRFFIELIRPEPIWALGLTFYQWASLAFAGALALQWALDRRLLRQAPAVVMPT
jgi:phosphatidylglycerol:prolipoprotein diacylglycerol transferase